MANMKLTEDQVKVVRELLEEGYTALEIAKQYEVAPNTVSDIKLGRTWKDVV